MSRRVSTQRERANVEDAKRREENCPKAHPSYES